MTVFSTSQTAFGVPSQKKVVADFEDFGTWRMRESSGLKVQAWWPAEVCLAGSDADRRHGDLVGELTFAFDPANPGPYTVGFERSKMSQVGGFLDGIEWEANAGSHPVSLRFQIQDATNRVFTTAAIPLQGEGWHHYRLNLDASTLPGFTECKFPARLKRLSLEAASPCDGRVFLDDLALTGRFARKDQLGVTPIYEKISFGPGEEVVLRYRMHNALPQVVSGTLRMEVRDFDRRKLQAREAQFQIEPLGVTEATFSLGKFSLGAYEVALAAVSADSECTAQDHFVVMVPNAGRLNRKPMWFGMADQTSWQGDLENRRHWEWMRLLGIDINRLELFADQFEPVEGLVNEAGWGNFIQGHADAGVDILLLYSTTPKWTHSRWQWRRPPDLLDKFTAHVRNLAGFLRKFPNVTHVEFWNEPDLEFFLGTLDEYLTIFERFSKTFRNAHPDVGLATGGVTVQHPHEKPGFAKGMYQRAGDHYDIAAYHAHGPLNNTEVRHELVEKWLGEAGVENKRLFNTETGDRSLYTADGRRRQAITLAKKIVFSKAQPNFDAYFWFTLQDYWDMDTEADDSFGLVTSDNRAKASFATYNTLIRQLANTTPVAEAPAVKDLRLFAFRRDDGRYVYAGWPMETKSSAILWVRTPQKLEVCDLFGTIREYEPIGNIVPVPIGSLPLYISGATPGEQIQTCHAGDEFLQVESELRYTDPQKTVSIPVQFRNPTDKTISGSLSLTDAAGREIARQAIETPAGGKADWSPEVVPSQVPSGGALQVELRTGEHSPVFSFPLRLIESHAIQKVPVLADDPAIWPSLEEACPILIDRPEQVIDLAYDPKTPAWKGPPDLSATARVVHDGRGIRFQIIVTDDVDGPVHANDQLWQGDDVQVAFGRADAKKFTILDLGKSAAGPAVWCSEHEDSRRIGQWKVPIQITKNGPVTTYDAFLPFGQLGVSANDRDLRFSFLVNENDGQGRIRWIEWTPGIARDRSIEFLGHGQLK